MNDQSGRENVTERVVIQGQYEGGPFDFGASYEDGSLDRVIASLLKIKELIPPEYRSKACCAISSDSYYDSQYATIEVSYDRPETDAEMAARLAAAEARRTATEISERAALAILQAKYGPRP